jgi:hypothetical protein
MAHMNLLSVVLASVLLLLSGCPAASQDQPQASIPAATFDFGKVVAGKVVEHGFTIRNHGKAPLTIQQVRLTSPLKLKKGPVQVLPGAEETLAVSLDTASLRGEFRGAVLLSWNDPRQPEAELTFAGTVVGGIEVSPRPVAFLTAQRGHGNKQAVLEIINHEASPATFELKERTTPSVSAVLETVRPGYHYRLNLDLNPNGPVGRNSQVFTLATSNPRIPTLKVMAHSYLHERVYTFPDVMDLGSMHLKQATADPERFRQTLMVYQPGGMDFQVKVSTSLPFLQFHSQRGPKGDRFQVSITLNAEKLLPGDVKGVITIETNDPEFSRLEIPVTGTFSP